MSVEGSAAQPVDLVPLQENIISFLISYFSTVSPPVSVEGLHAIVVTDRDGVPVIKGSATQRQTPSSSVNKALVVYHLASVLILN